MQVIGAIVGKEMVFSAVHTEPCTTNSVCKAPYGRAEKWMLAQITRERRKAEKYIILLPSSIGHKKACPCGPPVGECRTKVASFQYKKQSLFSIRKHTEGLNLYF